MPWKTIQGRRYLYKSVRIDGKRKSIYVGKGPAAELAYDQMQRRIARRKELWQIHHDIQEEVMAIRHLLEQVSAEVDLLMRAVLVTEGYYQHCRGPWRPRRFVYAE